MTDLKTSHTRRAHPRMPFRLVHRSLNLYEQQVEPYEGYGYEGIRDDRINRERRTQSETESLSHAPVKKTQGTVDGIINAALHSDIPASVYVKNCTPFDIVVAVKDVEQRRRATQYAVGGTVGPTITANISETLETEPEMERRNTILPGNYQIFPLRDWQETCVIVEASAATNKSVSVRNLLKRGQLGVVFANGKFAIHDWDGSRDMT